MQNLIALANIDYWLIIIPPNCFVVCTYKNYVISCKILKLHIIMLYEICYTFYKVLYLKMCSSDSCTCLYLNHFPNKPWFLRVCCTGLLKTPWEKEKLLVTSNSPFPAVFSSHFGSFLPFSSDLKLSSASRFSLEASKICSLGKG